MPAQNFRYYKGSEKHHEMVEFDVHRKDGSYETTCAVNVNLLLCKIWTYPCGNGDEARPNLIFECNGECEKVRYDDWNGVAAYSDLFNKKFNAVARCGEN